METSRKLEGKDLITIGVFAALYFVVVFVVAMLGLIPVFMVLLAVLVPLLGAIPFTMFLAKAKKPGMIFIMSVLMGVLMILTGMGFYTLCVAIVSGIAAELIWRSGGYRSAKKIVPTYAVFGLWIWGNYLPYFLNRDAYMASRANYGDAYWSALQTLLPDWMLVVLALACLACGAIGAAYAKRVVAKKLAAADVA